MGVDKGLRRGWEGPQRGGVIFLISWGSRVLTGRSGLRALAGVFGRGVEKDNLPRYLLEAGLKKK
jgi:hypothetical protein